MAEQDTIGQEEIPGKVGGRRWSDVWEHFQTPGGRVKAKCKKCHADLSARSENGTSRPWRHACKGQKMDKTPTRRPIPGPTSPQPHAAGESSGSMKPDGYREACEDLARMVAFGGYDPSFVEDENFRSFISRLNPEFEVPSRCAVEEICHDIFGKARGDLDIKLEQSWDRVNLAIGNAQTIDGTVFYTACHFIDDEWNLFRMVKDVYMVAPPGDVRVPLLTDHLDIDQFDYEGFAKVMNHYGIRGMIFSTSCGTIYGHEKLMGYLGDVYMTPLKSNTYVDVVLHSIAQCLLSNLGDEFKTKVRDKMRRFKLFDRLERSQYLLVLGMDRLQAYDEPWHSWFYWLQVLHENYGLSEFAKQLCMVWGSIYRAIQTISAPKLPTSNLCLRELFKVREILQTELAGANGDNECCGFNKAVADVLGEAKDILDRSIQDNYLVWSIPLVLDPRYKKRYIEFLFHRTYGSEGPKYISGIEGKIIKIFTDYSEGGETSSNEDGETSSKFLTGMADDRTDPLKQAWYEHLRFQEGKTELDRYLEGDIVDSIIDDFDILKWWREKSSTYPTMARIARAALAMPTCSKLSSEQTSHVRSIFRGYD